MNRCRSIAAQGWTPDCDSGLEARHSLCRWREPPEMNVEKQKARRADTVAEASNFIAVSTLRAFGIGSNVFRGLTAPAEALSARWA